MQDEMILGKNESLDYYIYELLYNKLGFKHKLRGSLYLIFCIEKIIKNNWKIYECKPTKNIYPAIASQFETTPQKVERAIRNAIEVTWKYMDDNIKKRIFSSYVTSRPSNMEFICAIYDYIQRDYFKNLLQKNNMEQPFNHLQYIETTNKVQLLECYIHELMYNKLNFKHKSNGSKYLVFYIEKIIIGDFELYNCSPTKDIYPTIASKFEITPKKVERAIRNSIEVAWKDMDDSIKQQVFPIIQSNRPTNTETIYAICDYVKAHNPLSSDIKTDEELARDKFKYYLRFEFQKMLEESYGIYSKFGITKLQILTDSIMIAIEMNGVSDEEMKYIISKISERYGLDIGTYELYDGYTQIDTVTPLLYKMCKQIYLNNNEDFPNPKDKTYIKSYLNILTEQVRNKYILKNKS